MKKIGSLFPSIATVNSTFNWVSFVWQAISLMIILGISSQFWLKVVHGPPVDLSSFVVAFVTVVGAIAGLSLALAAQIASETDDASKSQTPKFRLCAEKLVHATILGVETVALRFSIDQISTVKNWNSFFSLLKGIATVCLYFLALSCMMATVIALFRLSNLLWIRHRRRQPFLQ